MTEQRTVAYFSMEIGLEPGMPTYSGGLGVLAGDTVRSAADLNVPLVAVSLLHRAGYFHQRLDHSGWQTEQPVRWVVEDYLREMPARASVTIEGRTVHIRAWERQVMGCGGSLVPVYFLDSDLPENSEWDRTLTHFLYGGDSHYRLCQEVVLGVGGVRLLAAMGYDHLERFHMNEGHASFLALELLEDHARQAGRASPNRDDVEAVRRRCVFTTHTPVPAGHDQFPLELVTRVLGDRDAFRMKDVFCCDGVLNMTYLALNLSHYVNGVAKRHGEISQTMFARHAIDSITNGVHVGKAHPRDHEGKLLIQRLHQLQQQVQPEVRVAYLENYDMALGQLVTAGVDVWLNTPEPPLEASGTSGMKAALNGVPSLSILDGWWIEGCIEGVTGWSIGDNGRDRNTLADRARDATALYDKLEHAVIPAFYRERDRFIDVMRHAIALNGSFFNTQRMMQEYVLKAYFG